MKTVISCVLGLILCFSASRVYAQGITENEYRSRWTTEENSFAQQHNAEVSKEEKKKDVETYLQMGKDYLDKKDYATALMCFRSVIDLENELGSKDNIELATAEIARIEVQMQQEIKQDLNKVFGKSWPRREEGFKRILDRMPSTYTQKWAEEQEQKRIAAIESEKKKVRDEMRRRKLDLEQQVLQRSLEVNEELYIKRLELLKRQVEVDELLRYAKELFADHSYAEVMATADKVLGIDPNNSAAKSIRDDAAYRLEEEKIAINKKEVDTQRAIQEMKQKQVEETRRKLAEDITEHLAKGKDLFARNEFIDAITEFKKVMKLDGENLEAKLFIEQIKIKLEKTKTALENEPQETQDNQIEIQAGNAVSLNQDQPSITLSQEEVGLPVNATLNSAPQALRKIPKTNLSIPSSRADQDSLSAGGKVPQTSMTDPAGGVPQANQVTTLRETQPSAGTSAITIPARSNEVGQKSQAQIQALSAKDTTVVQTQPTTSLEPTSIKGGSPEANVQPLTPGELLKSSGGK